MKNFGFINGSALIMLLLKFVRISMVGIRYGDGYGGSVVCGLNGYSSRKCASYRAAAA